MTAKLHRNLPWIFLFSGLAILYLLFLRSFYLGFFDDDASFVLLAQSLLNGKFSVLFLPHQPPQTQLLPGFSLLLVPWVFVLGAQSAWLKSVPLLLTLGSVWLFKRLSQGIVEPRWQLVGCLFLGLNPILVHYSSALMSEPGFLFMTLASFVLLREQIDRPSLRHAVLLGFAVAWAALIRPTGAALIPAIGLALLTKKDFRGSSWSLGIAVSLWAGWMLRNYLAAQTVNSYLVQWQSSFSGAGESLSYLGQNAWLVLRCLFARTFLSLYDRAGTPLPMTIEALALFASLLILGAGLRVLWRDSTRRPLWMAMVFFYSVVLLSQSLWTAIDDRYFILFLPPLMLGIMTAASQWRRSVVTLVVLGAFAAIAHTAQALIRLPSRLAQPGHRLPVASLQWIASQTPPNSFVLGKAATTYLYTGRHARAEVWGNQFEEFRYSLLKEGITHVWLLPNRVISVQSAGLSQAQRADAVARWVRQKPKVYPLVQAFPEEFSEIYAVTRDPIFVEAFHNFIIGRELFLAGEYRAGFVLLDKALIGDPTLVSALNAWGAGSLYDHPRLLNGISKLEKAIRLAPEFVPAYLNLARAYQIVGQHKQSLATAMEGQARLLAAPEFNYLAPGFVELIAKVQPPSPQEPAQDRSTN